MAEDGRRLAQETIDALQQLQDDLDWPYVSNKFKITARKWVTQLGKLSNEVKQGVMQQRACECAVSKSSCETVG